MYKVGIIGCGKISQVRHIPEYAASGKAELVAFYDMNRKRAEELAEKFGGKAYESLEELLSSGLDAVSVCTSNATHAEIAVKALERGVNVLCEKPMAVTLDDCMKMVEAASKSGKILFIGQNQRLLGAHRKAKEIIESGMIGRVITFRTTFGHGGPETWSVDPGKNTWFFDSSKAVMGAMADLGIHKTDLITYLLSDRITAVTATLRTLDKRDGSGNLITVDDNALCIYEMASGVIGTMSASWTYYGDEDNSTVIYGSEGIMRIYSDPRHSITIEKRNGERYFLDIDRIQTNDAQTSSGVIDAFLASLDEKKSLISGESVLPAMRAVFAAIESSKTGKRVEIPENKVAL